MEKRFGERGVLRGIDLEIEAGRFVAIVGRSGGGKSTLLRLLAGLETASAGEVLLDGRPFTGLPGGVRMLFQDARLLPWQRVVDNVGIARGATGASGPRRSWRTSGWVTAATTGRQSCPVASGSASPWRAPW